MQRFRFGYLGQIHNVANTSRKMCMNSKILKKTKTQVKAKWNQSSMALHLSPLLHSLTPPPPGPPPTSNKNNTFTFDPHLRIGNLPYHMGHCATWNLGCRDAEAFHVFQLLRVGSEAKRFSFRGPQPSREFPQAFRRFCC